MFEIIWYIGLTAYAMKMLALMYTAYEMGESEPTAPGQSKVDSLHPQSH